MLAQGRFQQAEKILVGLLKENGNNPQALYSLAQVGLAAGALIKVIPLLTQCVQLLPDNPNPLCQLAKVRAELKQNQQTEQDYSNLIRLFPNWPTGYFSSAGFLQAQGIQVRAQECLEKAIELDPDHSGAYLALTNLVSMVKHQPLILAMEALLTKKQKLNPVRQTKNHTAALCSWKIKGRSRTLFDSI